MQLNIEFGFTNLIISLSSTDRISRYCTNKNADIYIEIRAGSEKCYIRYECIFYIIFQLYRLEYLKIIKKKTQYYRNDDW